MRIKFNDKIYRLKEIESGVDSLMELVEEQKYKDGDFLHSDWNGKNITIIYRKRNGNNLYYHVGKSNLAGLCFDKEGFWSDDGDFRLATESEKKELIDALAEVGKRWNTEKKCIEDIPKRKFKAGDKVRIKDGVSSKSQGGVYPYFEDFLDQYKVMTVKKYITTDIGEYITTSEAKRGDHHFGFAEDWLEPWSDEPKVGDWVVAWDDDAPPVVGVLDKIHDKCFKYRYSVGGMDWQNIIKFDGTKEHIEKIRKG